jgi:DNA-binding ferritin-like protein
LLKQADIVAERITALDGYPISTPAEQQKMACFEAEAEGELPLRTMLENDLKAFVALIAQVREHVALANREGDFGTAYMLQEMLFQLENEAHHLHHVLQANTL